MEVQYRPETSLRVAGKRTQQELIQKWALQPGLRGKINSKCIECVYDPYQVGNWRKQVEKCTCVTCPLYEVRPTSSAHVET